MSLSSDLPIAFDSLSTSPLLRRIGSCFAHAGGRAVLVGGAVRDMLLGREPKDLDIEVFGLSEEALVQALSTLGYVGQMGRAFKVWQVGGIPADFALPRAPQFDEAVRHRDLTINSMGLDLTGGQLLDPLGGQADLRRGTLRACDARYFKKDPLRGLRVAQLMARFEMQPDVALTQLCQQLDLSSIAPERLYVELTKLLMKAKKPSLGLMWLAETRLLKAFEALDALRGVAQDPNWHPEGDVWVHSCMVTDQAAILRDGSADDLALMWGALLHDVGKPVTTSVEAGRVRSPNHDVAGVEPARALLIGLKAPQELTRRVAILVRYHLAPAMLHASGASDRAYRRLCRALHAGHVSPVLLARLARADQLGRTTPAALRGDDPASEAFMVRIVALELDKPKAPDVVRGRDLILAGLRPGPDFAAVLEACRQRQDETGDTNPKTILLHVLGERQPWP